MIENLGEAYEAWPREMYGMIWWLAEPDARADVYRSRALKTSSRSCVRTTKKGLKLAKATKTQGGET
jgi:hypothetical protein